MHHLFGRRLQRCGRPDVRKRSQYRLASSGFLVPPSVAEATFETEVTVEEIADGVYLRGGGPANSYMVEFDDLVAVFEAPGNEERSLAVIEEIVSLAPGKPIRWVIATHPHFDHIGGLRT